MLRPNPDPLRIRALGLLLALAVAGCGGDEKQDERSRTATTTTATKSKPAKTRTRAPERPPALGAGASARAVEGRKLVIATGCLSCHQIGGRGETEPGNNLDGVGGRRSDGELRQALVQPPAGMPDYDVLSDGKLGQIVAYLSSLGGG